MGPISPRSHSYRLVQSPAGVRRGQPAAPRFRPECSCGWQGSEVPAAGMASSMHGAHVDGVLADLDERSAA